MTNRRLQHLGCLLIMITGLQGGHARSQDEAWHVVICGGILQETQASQEQARTIAGLSQFFVDGLGIDRKSVDILCDVQSQAYDANAAPCTRASLERTLKHVATHSGPLDRFVYYYTGQANRAADTLRLNVRGPDIVHSELVQWLNAIKAKQKLIVLDCPCAGLAVQDLTDPNHIVICSARSDQYDSPRFSSYFVPNLLKWEAAEGSGIPLLEIFQATCRDLDTHYAQAKCYKSENALLEDDGDGVPSQQPWLFKQSGKDGARAAQFCFRQAVVPPPGDQ
jgi:hypothetical protein